MAPSPDRKPSRHWFLIVGNAQPPHKEVMAPNTIVRDCALVACVTIVVGFLAASIGPPLAYVLWPVAILGVLYIGHIILIVVVASAANRWWRRWFGDS
jgi:hypothetical protein